MCSQSLRDVRFFATPWTIACQAPLSMEFFRQKYWGKLPFPTGIEPTYLVLLALTGRFFTTEPPGKPSCMYYIHFLLLSCVQLFAPRWTAACQTSLPLRFPRVWSNSCSLSWWCHLTISSFVGPFSSCLQSFPTSGSFPVSWLFTSGGQSIGDSASASVLQMNIQGWFLLGLTGLISLLSYVCVCVCVCVCVSLSSQLDNSTLF